MKILKIIITLVIIICFQGDIRPDEACNKNTPYLHLYGMNREISATSTLSEKYVPKNAFDNNLQTSWVEGKKDDGIGEMLVFINPEKTIRRIKIFPGFGMKKYFKKNNRIKKAKLYIYELAGVGAHQCGVDFGFGKLVKTVLLHFSDSMKFQEFDVGISKKSKSGFGYVCKIEILEVYRGTRWRDTCIAEVQVVK